MITVIKTPKLSVHQKSTTIAMVTNILLIFTSKETKHKNIMYKWHTLRNLYLKDIQMIQLVIKRFLGQ